MYEQSYTVRDCSETEHAQKAPFEETSRWYEGGKEGKKGRREGRKAGNITKLFYKHSLITKVNIACSSTRLLSVYKISRKLYCEITGTFHFVILK